MRVVRALVNWLVIFLSPVWVLPFLLFFYLSDKNAVELRTGKIWIWQ